MISLHRSCQVVTHRLVAGGLRRFGDDLIRKEKTQFSSEHFENWPAIIGCDACHFTMIVSLGPYPRPWSFLSMQTQAEAWGYVLSPRSRREVVSDLLAERAERVAPCFSVGLGIE